MRILFAALYASMFYQGMANKATATPETAADTVRKHVKKELVYPDPVNVSKLFYIQRDPNTNTLIYELNRDKNGEPDPKEPVHIYWIRYNDKGQKEEISYIQRKFAYGLAVKEIKTGEYDLRFAVYKKMPLTLMKGADGKYHIFTPIAKKQAILNRIFVRIEGGSFWIPNVVYVELSGTDPATGKEVMERFKP